MKELRSQKLVADVFYTTFCLGYPEKMSCVPEKVCEKKNDDKAVK